MSKLQKPTQHRNYISTNNQTVGRARNPRQAEDAADTLQLKPRNQMNTNQNAEAGGNQRTVSDPSVLSGSKDIRLRQPTLICNGTDRESAEALIASKQSRYNNEATENMEALTASSQSNHLNRAGVRMEALTASTQSRNNNDAAGHMEALNASRTRRVWVDRG